MGSISSQIEGILCSLIGNFRHSSVACSVRRFHICRSPKNVGSFVYPVFSLSYAHSPVGRRGAILRHIFTHTLDVNGTEATKYCKSRVTVTVTITIPNQEVTQSSSWGPHPMAVACLILHSYHRHSNPTGQGQVWGPTFLMACGSQRERHVVSPDFVWICGALA